MFKNKMLVVIAAVSCMLFPWAIRADNQFILSHPTSDPAPSVFTYNGEQRVYFYCTQDIIGGSGSYPIDTIHCYSTNDMYHWKDEGVSLDEKHVPWAKANVHKLWAPHIYYLKGLYQLIIPETSTDNLFYNFTAWSTNPVGPFTPASVGHLPGSVSNVIDPFVFIDTMGTMDSTGAFKTIDSIRVWLSYRHQNGSGLGFVRMNDSGTAVTGDINNALVNPGSATGSGYREGSWMWKRKGVYFLVFARVPGSGNEIIAYSTARNAMGPWTYRGQIFAQNNTPSEFTIHSGACDFKGQHYIWWHNTTFGGAIFGSERCSGIEYMTYLNDSTINVGTMGKTNRGVGIPNAYKDSIQIDRGVLTGVSTTAIPYNATGTEKTGWYLSSINNNASARYDSVSFTPDSGNGGPLKMFARYGSTIAGDTIDVRIDNATTGKLIGKLISKSTGSVTTWITDSSSLVQAGVTGNHNIFVNFRVPVGTNNLNVNWIKFGQGTPVAINTGTANHALPANYSYTRTNKNTFMIVSPAATANASVKLFNASGREVGAVSAKALTQSSIQVNLNAGFMASGAYILSVKNANGSLYSVPFVY